MGDRFTIGGGGTRPDRRTAAYEVSRKLRETAEARGISVNALILELLAEAVGGAGRRKRLERYATATAQDADALDEAIGAQPS